MTVSFTPHTVAVMIRVIEGDKLGHLANAPWTHGTSHDDVGKGEYQLWRLRRHGEPTLMGQFELARTCDLY